MSAPNISFEYFPPKTPAGREKLLGETTPALQALAPAFFSCTYGAGGTTRDNTLGIVSEIHSRGIAVAPHLSFAGGDDEDACALLDNYVAQGIRRLVALRGDMPSGMGAATPAYASELVSFVRKRHGTHFHIAVAAYPEVHPEAVNYDADIAYLKAKFEAGADVGITQYFYNEQAYFYFRERCAAAGIGEPIYAGIMPIVNYENLARFSAKCGAEIPRWICRRLEAYQGDADSVRKFGIEVVTNLCQTLLDNGCPGLHFYTMNQLEPTRSIHCNLNLSGGERP